ncbi:MAG: carbohydrate ABC transporter permease [Rhizobiales bacterium]|nr:carbohydrate ABC transporter permease [Hyphomicrobiales bacterium]
MTASRWRNSALFVAGLLACAVFLFPPFWALLSSFMPANRVGGVLDMDAWSLENYREVFAQQAFWRSLRNSAAASLGATIASTLLAIPAAYGLTRFRREFKGLALAILGVRMVPGIVLVLPFYMMFRQVHLLDTIFGLSLTYLTFTLPFSIWMISSFFEAVPYEIEEAAALDGASRWLTCWCILTPIAAPAILTTAVLNFIFCWNEFLFALIVTSQDALTFLPLLLRYVLPQGPLYGQIFAGSTIFMIPPLLALFLIRRRLSEAFGLDTVK